MLGFGISRLSGPSLRHDEIVEIYVAKGLIAHGWPVLPSGAFYPSALAHHALIAPFLLLFPSDTAFAARLPSVLATAGAVILVFFFTRRFLGRAEAVIAALLLATSPWTVAWSREARFYALQLLLYPAALWLAWAALHHPRRNTAILACACAAVLYVLSLFTAFHTIVFLGPVGAYAFLELARERKLRSRWTAALVVCFVLGVLTILAFVFNPNAVDRSAIFGTGLGGRLADPQRSVRLYYFRWLYENLSAGYFILAMAGFLLMIRRNGMRGLYTALAFWVPVLVLTFLIGYRRDRFLFFAFPFYVMAVSSALAWLGAYLPRALRAARRGNLSHAAAALLILAFGVRLAISTVRLVSDAAETAAGAPVTLASSHPDWDTPGRYVRTHRADEAVLATSCLPALHHAGHVDNWFPNRYTAWEYQEYGLRGLGSLDELKAFLAEHPRGYYLAEYAIFGLYEGHTQLTDLNAEIAWVERNMTRVAEASSPDVTMYRWDFTGRDPRALP